jgi:hypothetical protein
MRGWILIALCLWSVVEFFVYWWPTYRHDRHGERDLNRADKVTRSDAAQADLRRGEPTRGGTCDTAR